MKRLPRNGQGLEPVTYQLLDESLTPKPAFAPKVEITRVALERLEIKTGKLQKQIQLNWQNMGYFST